MSSGITSCCVPCAAAPVVTQPPAKFDGPPSKGTPPVDGDIGTCYEPAPEPVACGQYVPAPAASKGTPPPNGATPPNGAMPSSTDGDTPPAPIDPAGSTDATTGSTTTNGTSVNGPASSLPTWPQWSQQFTQLGLSTDEVATLGSANLTDEHLAKVYEHIHESIIAQGGVPGSTPITGSAVTGTSAWDSEWEQRFAALDLPQEFIAELRAEAQRRGSGDVEIERVYAQVVEKIQTTQAGDAAGEAGSTQGQQPGWNAEVEQAFRSLGMPDEVLQLYAQSGAPISGIEAAYGHAASRLQDFTERGWMEKFTAAGIDPLQTWSVILGDKTATDDELKSMVRAYEHSQESMWQRGGELATSLFPGGHLLKYVFGRDMNGDSIDRSSPMQIGMAALSGLAAFAAIRGGKNVLAGIAARNSNYAELGKVSSTLADLGLPRGGVEAMEQTALGATQTWGAKQKILSFIPGTSLHREVVGLGHAEAAARAFNGGGAARILANDADGALQLATITQQFDDLKSGAIGIRGKWNAFAGVLKKPTELMSTSTLRDGREVINVSKGLHIGNGNSQLVGLMQVGGNKLGANPEWLGGAANLVDDITNLSVANQGTLGTVMAGNLARDLGNFSNDGRKALKLIDALKAGTQPEWYGALANATRSQWPGTGMATASSAAGAVQNVVT